MTELLEVVASPWSSIAMVLLLFGFSPPAVLRVIVRAYPHGHPRRAELIAELEAVPYWRRPLWVAALIPACLDEGLAARRLGPRRERHAPNAVIALCCTALISIVINWAVGRTVVSMFAITVGTGIGGFTLETVFAVLRARRTRRRPTDRT